MIRHTQQAHIGLRHKAFIGGLLHHRQQTVEKAADIEHAHGLGMQAQLRLRHHFKQFFVSAQAAGQGDKGIGQFDHFVFALGHVGGFD